MGFFLVALAAAAAAIAAWLDFRFERFGPSDLGRALIHAGVALAVGWVAVPVAITSIVAAGGGALVAMFAVALPALIYIFLTMLWVVKHAQGLLLRR